ncbi:DUF6527 family protein [Marinobacter sp.]|uniref:DUF6527 family protein n=2 Tax=Marinobacter sp. TaxID=50741 RepID=UPI0035C74D47
MSWLKRLFIWFRDLNQRKNSNRPATRNCKIEEPPVVYSCIAVVTTPPKGNQLDRQTVYCVVNRQRMKWSMMSCPCGCGDSITLSLQAIHKPHWSLSQTESLRPTLYPSVWRDVGCFSHFWVRDGRVFWCADTGFPPVRSRF